jgi:hypothetical protein
MSTTIYEKNAGGLITTGERSVQTFPSGLVRVDRKYIGAQGNEAAHRALLAVDAALPEDDGAPAIDGLYIFPDIQESKDGTGFTTYLASAYGRTTTAGRITGYTQQSFKQRITPLDFWQPGDLLGDVVFNVRAMSGSIVIPRDAILSADDITIPESIYTPSNFSLTRYPTAVMQNVNEASEYLGYSSTIRRYSILFRFPETNETFSINIFLQDPSVAITAQRNFGRWTEIEYVTVRYSDYSTETVI